MFPPTPSLFSNEDGIWGLLFRSYSPKLGPSHDVLLPPAGSFKEHRHLVEFPRAFPPPHITVPLLTLPLTSFIQDEVKH